MGQFAVLPLNKSWLHRPAPLARLAAAAMWNKPVIRRLAIIDRQGLKCRCNGSHMIKAAFHASTVFSAVTVVALLAPAAGSARAGVGVSDPHTNNSFLALPALAPGGTNENTHRVVLYNHGGLGLLEGGDPEKVVRRLAEVGFIAYAKKRSGVSVSATLGEVQNGLDEVLDLTPDMLRGRFLMPYTTAPGVSVIGYSRGGLLALRIAELQATATKPYVMIDKVIIQAAAPGQDLSAGGGGSWVNGGATTFEDATTMDEYLSDGIIGGSNNIGLIDNGSTEFFMMAAANDQPPYNPQNSLVDLVTTAHQRMAARTNSAGGAFPVPSTLKIYDEWMLPESGHKLYEHVEDGGQDLINQPGCYWYDVVRFLKNQSIDTNYTVLLSSPKSGIIFSVK